MCTLRAQRICFSLKARVDVKLNDRSGGCAVRLLSRKRLTHVLRIYSKASRTGSDGAVHGLSRQEQRENPRKPYGFAFSLAGG